MKAEYLLANLTAKGVAIDTVGGGRSVLTKTEFAGALSGLDGLPYNIMRAVYMADESARLSAYDLLYDYAKRVFKDSKISKSKLEGLCVLAFFDAFHAAKCPKCRGTGTTLEAGREHICNKCGGTGKKHFSANAIADALLFPATTFRRKYMDGYSKLIQELQVSESEGLNHICRKCR